VVGNPWKNWIFVKLYTDEGIVGLGEATGGLATKPNEAQVEVLLQGEGGLLLFLVNARGPPAFLPRTRAADNSPAVARLRMRARSNAASGAKM